MGKGTIQKAKTMSFKGKRKKLQITNYFKRQGTTKNKENNNNSSPPPPPQRKKPPTQSNVVCMKCVHREQGKEDKHAHHIDCIHSIYYGKSAETIRVEAFEKKYLQINNTPLADHEKGTGIIDKKTAQDFFNGVRQVVREEMVRVYIEIVLSSFGMWELCP